VRILLLNQTFYPDVVSTAQHLTDLARALVERGHEVTVVTGRRAYDQQEIVFKKNEIWRGIRIHRVYSTRFGKQAKWRRALDFASFIASCCFRLVRLPRHDQVIALTTPPLISFVGALVSLCWRARFCYWVMDFNPDEAIAAGWLRGDSLIAGILERISLFSLKQATWIIALDRFMRDRMVGKGIPAEKITVVSPWSHDDEIRFDPVGREEFRRQHGINGKFVVMYSGNHSPVHSLDTLIEAARRLREEPDILFCFVGGGSQFQKIKQIAKTENLSQVLCLSYQPLDKLAGSLSAGDLHVVVMGEKMLGLVHPCKIYNIVGIGSPVLYIGPSLSHITDLASALSASSEATGTATSSPRFFMARHGEPDRVIAHIQEVYQARHSIARPAGIPALCSRDTLLPRLIAALDPS